MKFQILVLRKYLLKGLIFLHTSYSCCFPVPGAFTVHIERARNQTYLFTFAFAFFRNRSVFIVSQLSRCPAMIVETSISDTANLSFTATSSSFWKSISPECLHLIVSSSSNAFRPSFCTGFSATSLALSIPLLSEPRSTAIVQLSRNPLGVHVMCRRFSPCRLRCTSGKADMHSCIRLQH